METLEAANHDEIAMHQSLLFSESLKDLKNLRMQLYSAAEYFELSYTNDDQKQLVVETLKDYTIKAFVNTVDHLGAVSYKVKELIAEKAHQVSTAELQISSIHQRIRSCQEYFNQQGFAQQSSLVNIPKYHKRYILPVGEGIQSKSKHQGCSFDDEDGWHQFKNAVRATITEIPPSFTRKGRSSSPSPFPQASQQSGLFVFTGTMSRKDLERRSVSPRRFSLLRSGSISSRPTTPNRSRPTTPTSVGWQRGMEIRKSGSMHRNGDEEGNQIQSKSKRLLKALLSRPKSKKDDLLFTYLDEY